MRCKLGPKKLRFFERLLGVKLLYGFVRGNTEHRFDLWTVDKQEINLWKRGKHYIDKNEIEVQS